MPTSMLGGGRTWSAPIRVTPDQDSAVHIVQSVGAGPGIADVAWLADNSPKGYALSLRPFSIKHGWLAPVGQVSSQYSDPTIWPGDTFGISVFPRWNGPAAPDHVALSWGSAVGGSQNSEIYTTVVGRDSRSLTGHGSAGRTGAEGPRPPPRITCQENPQRREVNDRPSGHSECHCARDLRPAAAGWTAGWRAGQRAYRGPRTAGAISTLQSHRCRPQDLIRQDDARSGVVWLEPV